METGLVEDEAICDSLVWMRQAGKSVWIVESNDDQQPFKWAGSLRCIETRKRVSMLEPIGLSQFTLLVMLSRLNKTG